MSFKKKLHCLIFELPYFEYTLSKPLLILTWWKLKVTQLQKIVFLITFLAIAVCFHLFQLSFYSQLYLEVECYKFQLIWEEVSYKLCFFSFENMNLSNINHSMDY